MKKQQSHQSDFEPVVAILDAGAQYVDMIKKAAERHGFPSRIYPINTPLGDLPTAVRAIIVSGGPSSSNEEGAPMPDTKIWEQNDIPTFNVCYGMQALAQHGGGSVGQRSYREDGRHVTTVDTTHPLFSGVKEQTQALFTHGDFINSVPDDVAVLGSHIVEDEQVISAIQYKQKHVAVQFHPEVFDDTPQGYEMYGNFFSEICGLTPNQMFIDSQMERFIERINIRIKKRVGERHVIAFVSGGVDSSVATALVGKVIDEKKLHMYYIDNGFMRVADDEVIEQLRSAGFAVETVAATSQFERATSEFEGLEIGPLIETVDPRHKRRLIGESFVDIQDDIVAKLGLSQDEVVLLQGTNAADRIESGHSSAGGNETAQIKEHHNQVKRVRDLNPLEPLEDLFKDEIRALAIHLGLPDELAHRQPFPGPGLAIRLLGVNNTSNTDKSQATISELAQKYNCDAQILDVQSVGVGGDERSYAHPVALQFTQPPDNLAEISTTFTSRLKGTLNRVIVYIAGDDISTITPTETTLSSRNREILRTADDIAYRTMREFGLLRNIEQMPVIMIPCGSGQKRSIVLRPVRTKTHMTSTAMLPGIHLDLTFFETIANEIISELGGEISHVFFDATDKPPGTTEWE